jgi:hypothetical protein
MESMFKYQDEVIVGQKVSVEVNTHKNNVMSVIVTPLGTPLKTTFYMYSPTEARNIASMLIEAADAVDPKPAAQEDGANG